MNPCRNEDFRRIRQTGCLLVTYVGGKHPQDRLHQGFKEPIAFIRRTIKAKRSNDLIRSAAQACWIEPSQ
jgi:hypothetical protein